MPDTTGHDLAVPDDASVEPEYIFEGEVVDEPEPAPKVVVLRPVVQVITVVVQHPVPRTAVRHAGYVPAGVVVAWRRRRHARSRPERMMQQAEMQGDHAQVIAWRQQLEQEKQNRHGRIVKSAETVVTVARNSLVIGAVLFGCTLVLSLLLAFKEGVRGFIWPWATAADVAVWAVSVTGAVMVTVVAVAGATAVGVLHELGRRGGSLAPGWAMGAKPDEDDRGLVVTADTIVLALQNIPVPELKKAFANGWAPTFTLTPVRDGRGYEAEFSIPLGVTPEMIADRRPVLARNLHRDEIETWPSAGAPGYARLWVADPGAVSNAAPEYPLLHEGQADVFKGVPGGVLARGDGALIPVVAANGVLGGLMGQGKSNAGRVIVLGCCTDPLCGADVWVFANNGDFDAYEPRLARYEKGLDDEVIEAAVDYLHEAYRDVGERENMLADLGAKKVTRQLAEKYPELRPHVSLFSECHELFGHPEYGEMAGELAVKIVKRQRKTGRVAWFDTQSSRKAAIPGALVELVSVNCCFAVKSWRSNDGFLGDGSFSTGIRATELRPGRDRGTSLVTGISDSQFELLKWYFVEVNDDTGYDAAAEVIARCMREVAPGTPVAANSMPSAVTVRDLLDDLDAVIDGPDRVRLADLPPRLRKLAPTWLPYRALDGVQLQKLLDSEGVAWVKPKNVPQLDPAELDKAIRRREDEVS
jgi:S-DNA-T family DNA segregation ATPase FtsK/SpoIIIE